MKQNVTYCLADPANVTYCFGVESEWQGLARGLLRLGVVMLPICYLLESLIGNVREARVASSVA